jgi:hypothetical protein
MARDAHADAVCSRTAEQLTKLLGLRGLSGSVEWDGEQYRANGNPCGTSVHGVYEWMDAQPGVKP